ncbi:MAG: hypothetical protein K6G22_02895 [Lachnospiraceae bacterium]|nr:hypothetical protein [Lachnospiraceae bacterium]
MKIPTGNRKKKTWWVREGLKRFEDTYREWGKDTLVGMKRKKKIRRYLPGVGKRYFGGYEKEKEDLKIPTGSGKKKLWWV